MTIIPHHRSGFGKSARGLIAIDLDVSPTVERDLFAYRRVMAEGFCGVANAGNRSGEYQVLLDWNGTSTG